MPPPRGTHNPLEGPGDYDVTKIIHNDTYPAIDPTKADFSGRAIFISGASRGLGRAIAISFARAGASFIAIGARSDLSTTERVILSAAKNAGRNVPKILCLKLDVKNQASTELAAAEVEKTFHRIDVVVNNAGVMGPGEIAPIADSTPDAWWDTWNVNLRVPYLVTRAFLPLLQKDGGGAIVTLSSVGAHVVTPGLSAYQPSKLAVLRFSDFVSQEYGDKGIVSFCIHPGNIPTDIVGGMEGLPVELKPIFVETPELSADSIVFLTKKKREWLGGRNINSTWDMLELMEKRKEIIKGDKLKVRLVF